MGMDRKLQACLEQELIDTKEELRLCKQRTSCKQKQQQLYDWISEQAHKATSASSASTYKSVLVYLEKLHESN